MHVAKISRDFPLRSVAGFFRIRGATDSIQRWHQFRHQLQLARIIIQNARQAVPPACYQFPNF